MQIIEERIVLAGVEFTKSELVEIANLLELDPANHDTLYLKVPETMVVDVPVYDSAGKQIALQKQTITGASLLRKSLALQKALLADLFEANTMGSPIKPRSELKNAVIYYRGQK